jgi:hypothetical protein
MKPPVLSFLANFSVFQITDLKNTSATNHLLQYYSIIFEAIAFKGAYSGFWTVANFC